MSITRVGTKILFIKECVRKIAQAYVDVTEMSIATSVKPTEEVFRL
jgi:hypothetical protein